MLVHIVNTQTQVVVITMVSPGSKSLSEAKKDKKILAALKAHEGVMPEAKFEIIK